MNVQVSNNFKKMTSNAIFAIVMFTSVYLILLVLSLALTVLCVLGGFGLIVLKPMVITIGLGVGLASLGFFILIFLFKFLFKKHKIDRSHLTEITQQQEPILFKFIQQIVDEVETDFPKKIYLSTDVNASVFYDSSFWSMFLPIKKNLQIGLGLVNCISEQEFKAILAHEFGHFSQRSMKVGSYVYNVNQVIYNMLYDNESFDTMIQKWANMSSYFSIFVMIAVKIIQGIQWILKKMYEYINISYMALSREMEFHADEIAANVAGYVPLKESLLRMNLADHAYYAVLNFYGNKIEENVKSHNIFREQQFVMNFLAKESELPFKNNLPMVSEMDLNKYNKSKLNIKDQWASHPSTEERVEVLEKLGIVKDFTNDHPAILLFNKSDNLQETLTENIFSTVSYEGEAAKLESDRFESEFMTTHLQNSFDKKYGGYYDDKNLDEFEVNKLSSATTTQSFDTLFSKEKVDMVYDYIGLMSDKNLLINIANNQYPIKTFDYDGQKYSSKDANILITQLEKDAENLKNNIHENDKNIYVYFLKKTKTEEQKNELKNSYKNYFSVDKEYDKIFELYNNINNSTNFVSVVTPFDQIETNFSNLKTLETELKVEIKKMLNNDILQPEISKTMKDNFESYLSNELNYFSNENYDNENLKILFRALNDSKYLLSRNYFLTKKNLLNYQIQLLEN